MSMAGGGVAAGKPRVGRGRCGRRAILAAGEASTWICKVPMEISTDVSVGVGATGRAARAGSAKGEGERPTGTSLNPMLADAAEGCGNTAAG